MEYTKKLIYQSNYWYNDALARANMRDMSGAIASLKRSLQYNRENIAARNLLGLVYFGIGNVAEALVEWIISKNLKSHENIANYYIKKVQETPSELEVIDQAVKKYNQCLAYCYQNGEDLAIIQLKKIVVSHPTFLKAHQLLALLYLQAEQYPKARQCLRQAHKLDTTNDITRRYMHELSQRNKKRTGKLKEKKDETVTYNLGNETIIQPASAILKDNAGTLTIMNILIGIAVGAAVIWFLVMPAANKSKAQRQNKEALEYSEQIGAQKAQIRALQKELENFRATSDETEEAKQTASDAQASYESLMALKSYYDAGYYSDAQLADEILKINRASLGVGGQTEYDAIAGEVIPRLCEDQYSMAQASYKVANYATSISTLETVMRVDERYQDGAAMILLGDTYLRDGDVDQANKWYAKAKELFPDSEIAEKAAKGLSGVPSDSEEE